MVFPALTSGTTFLTLFTICLGNIAGTAGKVFDDEEEEDEDGAGGLTKRDSSADGNEEEDDDDDDELLGLTGVALLSYTASPIITINAVPLKI